MTFQTQLSEEQKASVAGKSVFEDPVKVSAHHQKTRLAIVVGIISGMVIFILTPGLGYAILAGVVLGGLITGALLPEENKWQS